MLDIIGSIGLTALAVVCASLLIVASRITEAAALRLASLAGVWFLAVVGLGAAGFFSSEGMGVPAIGLAVVAPVVVGIAAAVRASTPQAIAFGVPLTILVALHVGRLLGAFFLLLHAQGRVPPTFALSAGWGDITVAALAGPLAWAVHRRVVGWRTLTLAWNSLGFLDLVTAVTLGMGSAPDSPIRFIFESSAANTMGTLPWLLIPAFLVPIYLLTHLAIFAQLARNRTASSDRASMAMKRPVRAARG